MNYMDYEEQDGNLKTRFWLVWVPNKDGGQNPRKRHTSEEAAEKEARRIASKSPNTPVYVLETRSQVKLVPQKIKLKQMV